MKKIGLIDADLIGRSKHRFPNLVIEKLAGFYSKKEYEVELLTDYHLFPELLGSSMPSVFEDLSEMGRTLRMEYDKIFIAKVFTDTECPLNEFNISQLCDINDTIDEFIVEDPVKDACSEMVGGTVQITGKKIIIGGTGFYFDKAPNLPTAIENWKPDYHIYDEWISKQVDKAQLEAEKKGKVFNKTNYMVQFKEYTDYSIGYMTRGCFRKCGFCVNQKYSHVFRHSKLQDFYDDSRKKICLLDDNILGCPQWKSILEELNGTKKSYKFKQGMDERLLTEEKCEYLFNAPYDGDYTFAFDKISDYELIHKKLKLIRKYTNAVNVKFYVLVGFESTDADDIENMWKRVALLMKYRCLPYIMRYQNKNETPWKNSKYRTLYVTMARWCNQPSFFKKKSFREYCEANQALVKTKGHICSSMKALIDFEEEYPEIAQKYFDLRFDEF